MKQFDGIAQFRLSNLRSKLNNECRVTLLNIKTKKSNFNLLSDYLFLLISFKTWQSFSH